MREQIFVSFLESQWALVLFVMGPCPMQLGLRQRNCGCWLRNSLCPLRSFIRNQQPIPDFSSISGEQQGSGLPRLRCRFVFLSWWWCHFSVPFSTRKEVRGLCTAALCKFCRLIGIGFSHATRPGLTQRALQISKSRRVGAKLQNSSGTDGLSNVAAPNHCANFRYKVCDLPLYTYAFLETSAFVCVFLYVFFVCVFYLSFCSYLSSSSNNVLCMPGLKFSVHGWGWYLRIHVKNPKFIHVFQVS